MEQIQVLSTSPKALANLISESVREQVLALRNDLANVSSGPQKEVMSRAETAEFFDISLVTLHQWVRGGIIKPYKVGNKTYFFRSELMQVVEQSNPGK